MGSYTVLVLFAFLVEGVFGDAVEVKPVMEGDLVTLNTDVIKEPQDMVRWYFNNTLIALINGDSSSSCKYDGEGGRFRGRLKVEYKTGSLNITDIRSEHTGPYEAELIRSESSGKSEKSSINRSCDNTQINTKISILGKIIKTFNLTVSASKADKNEEEPHKEQQNQNIDATVPGSGRSSAAVAGIFVGVGVLLVAAVVGVMIYRRRSSRNDMKKNKQVPEQESKDEKPNEEKHMI